MDTKELLAVISIVVSFIALILAIISLMKTMSHNAIMRGFAAAGPDLQLLGQINAARKDFEEVLHKLLVLRNQVGSKKPTLAEQRELEGMESQYDNAIEKLLNIYETACGLYLDGKVEKVRFKKYYFNEIQELMERSPEGIKNKLDTISSKFKAIRKVYDEWHNLEK